MSAAFSNAALMQGGSDVELFEKDVNLVKNAYAGLRSGTDAAMSHLSPFLLILLCFLQIHYKSKGGALQLISYYIKALSYFWVLSANPES